MGTSGHVFESLLVRGEPSPALENPERSASSSCRLRPIDTGKIAKQRGIEKRTEESYNTNFLLSQEVFDLESSVSNRTYPPNFMILKSKESDR